MTTVTQDYDRVCMHGVRTALLEQQAAAVGLPLDMVQIRKDRHRRTTTRRCRPM